MTTETNETGFANQIITQLLATWAQRNTAVTNFITKYKDESAYLNEIAPGRNRPIYLFGHLISTTDGLLPLFGFGERQFPELEAIFSTNPDRTFESIPSLDELKQKWEKVNSTLTSHFNKMTPADWLSRHTAVSEEDFKKEPQRNKINLLIGRTNHQSYHLGQMNLLTVEAEVV